MYVLHFSQQHGLMCKWFAQVHRHLCNLYSFLLPYIFPPAVTVGDVTSSISRRFFSPAPRWHNRNYLKEIRLHQETPISIRHTVTHTLISALCFFLHFCLCTSHPALQRIMSPRQEKHSQEVQEQNQHSYKYSLLSPSSKLEYVIK